MRGILLAMIVRSHKHENWALRELDKIAHKNSNKKNAVISVASLIRYSTYQFILKNSRHPGKITKQLIDEAEFRARKACHRDQP